MDKQHLTQHLVALSDADFLEVLEAVFAQRRPNLEEDTYNHNRYFLGTASQERTSDSGEPEQWGSWSLEAVAYINRTIYPDGMESDIGFCQFGTCPQCHTAVRSYVKNGYCPICRAAVYMT
jgi:hypothetical protein